MRRERRITCAAALVISCWCSVRAAEQPVLVFVKAAKPADGFVDPKDKREDSVKDVQNRVRKTKGLTLIEEEGGADIVLVVAGRGVESERSGSIARPVGDAVVASPTYQNWLMLYVTLEMGSYRKEFSAGARFWGDAARFVGSDIGKWVAANRAQIIARRTK